MEYKSSLNEFDYFIASHVYADLQDELESWLEEARILQDAVDSDEKELWRCQGRVQIIKSLMDWAEVTRELIENE